MKYYKIHNSLFENIGNKTFRCIASTRKNMVGTMIFNPELNKPWITPVDNKEEAIHWMKEDAYWDNCIVYEEEGK